MLKARSFLFIIFFSFLLNSCGKMRESAGVTRKTIDEFQVIENPPLVIPPDFNLVSSDQLQQKNIDDIDKELAREILFGLSNEDQNEQKISTINKILSGAEANDISNNIRNQIDEIYAQEKNTEGIINIDWEDEIEVLDAIAESQRLRNKNFEDDSNVNKNVPIKKKKVKKKKRFIFF